jgi:hypothetical protein
MDFIVSHHHCCEAGWADEWSAMRYLGGQRDIAHDEVHWTLLCTTRPGVCSSPSDCSVRKCRTRHCLVVKHRFKGRGERGRVTDDGVIVTISTTTAARRAGRTNGRQCDTFRTEQARIYQKVRALGQGTFSQVSLAARVEPIPDTSSRPSSAPPAGPCSMILTATSFWLLTKPWNVPAK